jgi:hypothetical protein
MSTRILLTLAVACCCYHPATRYDPTTFANLAGVPPVEWIYLERAVHARDASGHDRAVTAGEQGAVDEGIALANAVLKSDCFKTGVLAATMTHTDDLTASEVYAIMTRLPVVALKYDLYDGTAAHGTMGYDDSGSPDVIHLNLFFVKDRFAIASVTLHEAAHLRGFIHKSSKEGSSVPYTMNYIFEQCAKKSLEHDHAPPPALAPIEDHS